jgi:hypothetical protein
VEGTDVHIKLELGLGYLTPISNDTSFAVLADRRFGGPLASRDGRGRRAFPQPPAVNAPAVAARDRGRHRVGDRPYGKTQLLWVRDRRRQQPEFRTCSRHPMTGRIETNQAKTQLSALLAT